MTTMPVPTILRRTDDRVLGKRLRRRQSTSGEGGAGAVVARTLRQSSGKGLRQFLSVTGRVAKLVLLLLAAVVLLGIVFTLAPTNGDNVIVSNVLELARDAAGPFRDVYEVSDDADRELVVNYGLAALVFFVGALLVGRLGRGSS